MTIALIAIPHEQSPTIFWFDDRDDVLASAIDLNEFLLSDCPKDFHQAIRFLSQTWRSYILIESATQLHKVRNYLGHQRQRVPALLEELENRFAQDESNAKQT